MVGAGLGLLVAFITSGGLDGIPAESTTIARLLPRGVQPALLAAPGLGAGAPSQPVFGLAGALP